jgi:hypothetical protein
MKRPLPELSQSRLQDAVATSEVLFSLGQSEAQAIVAGLAATDREEFARSLSTAVLGTFWRKKTQACGCPWELRKAVVTPLRRFSGLVERLGGALSTVPGPRAGYLVGQLYTALLPDAVRKRLGAFYTPPPLADRLLQLVTDSGFDWGQGRIVDPACGGAAFLVPLAAKVVAASFHQPPISVLEDLETRLAGMEVDCFAAWMSMVLLDVALLELTIRAGRPLRSLVLSRDALQTSPSELGQYDLIAGNPPYGKVSLTSELRESFRESLFGHANLYGLFTELAVRLAKNGGLVAYVTPTSFLGGEYFKNLRKFLSSHAPLRRLEFVSSREGVFGGVLQETMLALFERRVPSGTSAVQVNLLHANDVTEPVSVEAVGRVPVNCVNGSPWLLPRSRAQTPLVRRLNATPQRLADYGYAVSTGQLVWNRHKDQLRSEYGADCYPIVWAEAVSSDGRFQFQAARRSHLPYLKIRAGQDWLINQEPCILVQRTTAKEQKRRLIVAVMPNSFIMEYPGFVVENHLNMVYAHSRKPRVALRTLAVLLNSTTLDQVFRCINGSVAVSAYELNSLPLPDVEQMKRLQGSVFSDASPAEIEEVIASFYTALHERPNIPAPSHSCLDPRRVAA